MIFKELAKIFQDLEDTSSRLELRDTLRGMYKKLTPQEASIASYFIIGRLAPKFIPIEFNISKKSIEKILTTLLSIDNFKDLLNQYSDEGDIIKHLWNEPGRQLSITEIYDKLWLIAKSSGVGSVYKKQEQVINLLKSVSNIEAKFIIRIILGTTRLGVNERTLLDALSAYVDEDVKINRKKIEQALGLTSDIGYIAQIITQRGIKGLSVIKFTPGIPIASKLVERVHTINDIFKRIPAPIEEPKYDGLRCQIHIFKPRNLNLQDRIWSKYVKNSTQENLFNAKDNFTVKLFSRNLEEITQMFPEIVESAINFAHWHSNNFDKNLSYVFDSEVVGYNENTEEFLPFQETMKRKRKYNVKEAASEIPVKAFVFDSLFFGENLMNKKLKDRKEYLQSIQFFNQEYKNSNLILTPTHYTSNSKQAEDIFYNYITEGLEGVIFKDPESTYTPGVRNFDWIKFKKAMKSELADTIDVVILGYYYGTGRLAKLGIGALLTGIYDKSNDEFLTISKIGTGITDDLWVEIKSKCDNFKIEHKLANVKIPKELMPDVLLVPKLVIEVEADQITKSPIHSSGYALRFPRFKRFRNKDATEATSLQELKEML